MGSKGRNKRNLVRHLCWGFSQTMMVLFLFTDIVVDNFVGVGSLAVFSIASITAMLEFYLLIRYNEVSPEFIDMGSYKSILLVFSNIFYIGVIILCTANWRVIYIDDKGTNIYSKNPKKLWCKCRYLLTQENPFEFDHNYVTLCFRKKKDMLKFLLTSREKYQSIEDGIL